MHAHAAVTGESNLGGEASWGSSHIIIRLLMHIWWANLVDTSLHTLLFLLCFAGQLADTLSAYNELTTMGGASKLKQLSHEV